MDRLGELAKFDARAGDYVAYVDEDDPASGVGYYRADGTLVMFMSTETYRRFTDLAPTPPPTSDPRRKP